MSGIRLIRRSAKSSRSRRASRPGRPFFGAGRQAYPFFTPQPKLSANAPGDRHEQEADRVADRVMRMPAPATHNHAADTAQASSQTGTPGQTGGQALSETSRRFFEPRFASHFTDVRIHHDAHADRLARHINARAFTFGKDIVFAAGQYQPDSKQGRHLLAHELGHVIQQRRASSASAKQIQRKKPPAPKPWLPELDAILPKGVGLLTHIDRVTMLVDIFGFTPLEEHVRLIHADAAATRLTKSHGVPGIVALYDTRAGNKLNVAAAQQALTKSKSRYQRKSIQGLRLAPELKAGLLTPKEIAALRKKMLKLKTDLKSNYGLADVADGDVKWSIDHLEQVTQAFKLIPPGDKKALKGVVLKRVASLGAKTAGQFKYEQGVEDTAVTNNATLELANLAFAQGAPDSYRSIVHEVGHAVASLQVRTTAHAEHLAIAEENRLIGLAKPELDKYNQAVDETNKTVDPYNAAVKKYNAARRSRDKARIAATKKVYLAAKKAYDTKKAIERHLKAVWEKAEKKVKAAKKITARKEKAAKRAMISSTDLKAIKSKSVADKKRHGSRLAAANKKLASLKQDDINESQAYVTAVRDTSNAISNFATQTADQSLSVKDVEALVTNTQNQIDTRDSEIAKLTTKNKHNPALGIFSAVVQAQDAWFMSAKAHSLAQNRSARVQKFVKFVDKKRITPRTIFPKNSYAEENWPHKPEEFYAEVYSLFFVKPNDLKAKSKTLYNWFKTKKYL